MASFPSTGSRIAADAARPATLALPLKAVVKWTQASQSDGKQLVTYSRVSCSEIVFVGLGGLEKPHVALPAVDLASLTDGVESASGPALPISRRAAARLRFRCRTALYTINRLGS